MSSVLKRIHYIPVPPVTLLLFLTFSYFFLLFPAGAIAVSKSKITLTAGQIELLASLEQKKLLHIEPYVNKAYVKEALWYSMEPHLKEDFAATIATYCANKRNVDLYYVTIYGYASGRKLAKYSLTWGFTTY